MLQHSLKVKTLKNVTTDWFIPAQDVTITVDNTGSNGGANDISFDNFIYGVVPDVTVDFNDITSATISGVYGGIDWGTDLWQRGGPAGEYMNSTNIATNTHWGDENWGPANVSGLPLVDPIATNVIKLPAGTVLKSFQVVGNDGTDNGTVTVSSPGNPDVTVQLEGQTLKNVTTDWLIPAQDVTITIDNTGSNGGANDISFDNFIYGVVPDVTVDFNDITSATISGVYGGIDWGTDLWQRGGPAGEYMNSTNIATNTHWGDENWGPANVSGLPLVDPIATNVIKLPAGTVLKSFQVVGNDSTDNGTVTLSSPGNPDVTVQLEGQTFKNVTTDWFIPAQDVTITVDNTGSNGGANDISFDNFIYGSPYYSPDNGIIQDVTVGFDSYNGQNGVAITGIYGGINWSDDAVRWSDANGGSAPKWRETNTAAISGSAIYIDTPAGTSLARRAFSLPKDRVLKSVQLAGLSTDDTGTVTFTSPGNPDVTVALNGTDVVNVTLNWTAASSLVVVSVKDNGTTGGRNVTFDNFVYGDPGTVTPPESSASEPAAPNSNQTPEGQVERCVFVDEGLNFDTPADALGLFNSPVTTYNGNLYMAWIRTGDNHLMIAKKDADGNITTADVSNTSVLNGHADIYHKSPSIAVDKDGYIHAIGGQRGLPWQYWKSTKPEDITSFEFAGNTPGDPDNDPVNASAPSNDVYISYAAFSTDREGNIYLTWAKEVDYDLPDYLSCSIPTENYGTLAGAMARYDCTTKKWTEIGGINYPLSGNSYSRNNGFVKSFLLSR